MGKFHNSIETRMDAFSLRIDKVWADSFDFEEEIRKFCRASEATMNKFIDFNDKAGEAMNDPTIPEMTKRMLELQTDTLTDIVEKNYTAYMEMIYKSREEIDTIRGFREVMIKDMQKMADNKKNAALADRTMTSFEKSLDKFEKDNEIIRKRIDTVKSGFGEAEKYYESLKN